MQKKIFEREIPEVVRAEDFMDQRAREIVEKNFIRIKEIPGFYYELERLGGRVALDAEKLKGNSLPIEYYQLLAGAIMHYELTKRPNFKIQMDKIRILDLGIVNAQGVKFGVIKRRISVYDHESFGNGYAEVAENIYLYYEKINRK